MRPLRMGLPFAAAVVAIVGGGWIGFSWCGGYSWHRHVIAAVLAFLVGATVFLPPAALKSTVRRMSFALGIAVIFTVAQGGASLFYPATPTWTEFMQKLPGSIAGERC